MGETGGRDSLGATLQRLEAELAGLRSRLAELESEISWSENAVKVLRDLLGVGRNGTHPSPPNDIAPPEKAKKPTQWNAKAESPASPNAKRGHASAMMRIVRESPGLTHGEVVKRVLATVESGAINPRKSISNTLWWLKTAGKLHQDKQGGLYLPQEGDVAATKTKGARTL